MLTLGGSIVTTRVPPSSLPLQNPGTVSQTPDLTGLAVYYNTTLSESAAGNYANASHLLGTFRYVNIPASVNGTAQAANADLGTFNSATENATVLFALAQSQIRSKEYINATASLDAGCGSAGSANATLSDFAGPQTSRFEAEGVPVGQYEKGLATAESAVASLVGECSALRGQLPSPGGTQGAVLLIGSPQASIVTGGPVKLSGNFTVDGTGVAGEDVLFYINGSYFGELVTAPGGTFSGSLTIPFVYSRWASVEGLVLPNATGGVAGATSNVLVFEISFSQTAIVVADPPAVLPTFSFVVRGNLTTTGGVGLPEAPVRVTFMGESQLLRTDFSGRFKTTLTVPANASDGVYEIYASFAPQGIFGPSFNFTTVQVVHLPASVVLSPPSRSWAGFPTTLEGEATSNGSALAGAAVTLRSPWGSESTTTNATGGFRVTVPVSLFEFALSRNVTASVRAVQPYIATASAAEPVGVFNVLALVIPVVIVGLVAFEADRLGLLEGAKGRSRREEEMGPEAEPESYVRGREGALPEAVQLYERALVLASSRLSIRFRRSDTIRENLGAATGKASAEDLERFREVLLTAEDCLYAPALDPSRLDAARKRLSELERRWR